MRPDFDPNNAISFEEGWAVFESTGPRPYRLERDDETNILADDAAAWRHVAQQVSYGSAHHLRTLQWLRLNSPAEFWSIARFCKLEVEPTIDELKAALASLMDAYSEHDELLDDLMRECTAQEKSDSADRYDSWIFAAHVLNATFMPPLPRPSVEDDDEIDDAA